MIRTTSLELFNGTNGSLLGIGYLWFVFFKQLTPFHFNATKWLLVSKRNEFPMLRDVIKNVFHYPQEKEILKEDNYL